MSVLTEMVTLEVNGKSTAAYVAVPEGDGPWPGVVVIQEWWGLEEHIKDVARRFAAGGFVAIAPDLYYGEVATEPDEARKLRMALDWDKALTAIQVAIDTLLARADVSPKKVAVTGFCMGGGLTWHAAAKLKHVAVTAPFYGGGPEMTDEEVAQIGGPVLAIFGELDQGVSPEVANSRAAQMDKVGIRHNTIIYPNAQHAFFNDTRAAYNPEAAADAWQRVVDLFRETLQGQPSGSGAGDSWSEVGRQFRALGESLAAALKATVGSEENRPHIEKMQSELNAAADEIVRATKKAMDSEEAKKVQAEAVKAAQSAKAAGQQTVAEIQPHLLAAFRTIRTELDQMISRMEQTPSSPKDSADEATSTKTQNTEPAE